MWVSFGIALLIIATCMVFLCVRLFFHRSFPHTHVEGNKAMRKKGIYCIRTMDAMERKGNPHKISERKNKTKQQ